MPLIVIKIHSSIPPPLPTVCSVFCSYSVLMIATEAKGENESESERNGMMQGLLLVYDKEGFQSSSSLLSSSSLITQLPPELFRIILTYISFQTLPILEMALLNKSIRLRYLDYLHGFEPSDWHLTERSICFSSACFHDWIVSRNLKVVDLHIFLTTSFRSYHMETIQANIRSLKNLSIQSGTNNQHDLLLCTFPYCPSLNTLTVNNCNFFSYRDLQKILESNSQISRLKLCHVYKFTSRDVLNVVDNSSLRELYLEMNLWVTDDIVMVILSGNLRLDSFSVRWTRVQQDLTIQKILQRYPNIYHLAFDIAPMTPATNEYVLREVAIQSLLSRDHWRISLSLDYFYGLFQMNCNCYIDILNANPNIISQLLTFYEDHRTTHVRISLSLSHCGRTINILSLNS